MNYQARNTKRIGKAFDRLKQGVRDGAKDIIVDSVQAGYDRVVELHRTARHELHLVTGGDFGSAVIDGKNIEHVNVMMDPAHFSGKVVSHMKQAAERDKVTGIVMSEMAEGIHDESFEVGVLGSGARVAFGHALAKMHNLRIK